MPVFEPHPDHRPVPAAITETGIVALAHAGSTARVPAAVQQLLDGGVRCVALALTTPDVISELAVLVAAFGEQACIGASSVSGAGRARECIAAGAQFLIAPSMVPDVVAIAAEAGVACLPGALTPSEIVAAWTSGAAAVTLFPASLGGPSYLREVRIAVPGIPLVASGGVTIDAVPDYLSAGAAAVGLGSVLFGDALRDGDLASLARRAERAVTAVRVAREGRPV